MAKKHRKIIFFKHYFNDFFIEQELKLQKKILWTFDLIEELQIVPIVYLKQIANTNGLYEIRVQNGNDIYRIFCFFNHEKCVVLGNAFQKKTEKTPINQLMLAQKIKIEYEQETKN